MDLFRFFIPFLDPNCLTSPLTKIELEELAGLINTLRRSLDMQCKRNKSIDNRTVDHEKLESLAKAVKYCEDLIRQLIASHPGDTENDIKLLLQRVKKIPGAEEFLVEISGRLTRIKQAV